MRVGWSAFRWTGQNFELKLIYQQRESFNGLVYNVNLGISNIFSYSLASGKNCY